MHLCGINLVFIGPTEYGILHSIHWPTHSILVNVDPKPTSSGRSKSSSNKKTTCCEGRTTNHKRGRGSSKGVKQTNLDRWACTLSESRNQNYGITPPTNPSTCTLRSGRQPVDYLSLNDGLDDDILTTSKKRKRVTHRPRSAPLVTRVAAQKHTISPEAKGTDNTSLRPSTSTLSAVPSTSAANELAIPDLTGVPTSANMDNLPDLVINREILEFRTRYCKNCRSCEYRGRVRSCWCLVESGWGKRWYTWRRWQRTTNASRCTH